LNAWPVVVIYASLRLKTSSKLILLYEVKKMFMLLTFKRYW